MSIRTALAEVDAKLAGIVARFGAAQPPGAFIIFDRRGVPLVTCLLRRPAFERVGPHALRLRRTEVTVTVDGTAATYALQDAAGSTLLSGPVVRGEGEGLALPRLELQVGDAFDVALAVGVPFDPGSLGSCRLIIADAAGSPLADFDMPAPDIADRSIRFGPVQTIIAATGRASGFRLLDAAGIVVFAGPVGLLGDERPAAGSAAFSSLDFQAGGELSISGFTLEVTTS